MLGFGLRRRGEECARALLRSSIGRVIALTSTREGDGEDNVSLGEEHFAKMSQLVADGRECAAKDQTQSEIASMVIARARLLIDLLINQINSRK